MLVDAAGTVRIFNPSCERLFRYAAGEVIGRRVEALLTSRLTDDDGHPLGRNPPADRAPVARFPLIATTGGAAWAGGSALYGLLMQPKAKAPLHGVSRFSALQLILGATC
jgi:PAS domain-containing protein